MGEEAVLDEAVEFGVATGTAVLTGVEAEREVGLGEDFIAGVDVEVTAGVLTAAPVGVPARVRTVSGALVVVVPQATIKNNSIMSHRNRRAVKSPPL